MEASVVPDSFIQRLKEKEGFSSTVYRDKLGKLTVGTGHLLTPEEQLLYREGDEVPQDQLDAWLREDSAKAYSAAINQAQELGQADNLTFLDALGDVNYQLGTNWYKKLDDTWGLMKQGRYKDAGYNVLDTLWASDAQTPTRAQAFSSALFDLDSAQPDDIQPAPPTQFAQAQPQTITPTPAPAPINPMQDYFARNARASAAIAEGFFNPDLQPSNLKPSSLGETFKESVRAGGIQLESDVRTFGAMAEYLFTKDEDEFVRDLNETQLLDETAGQILSSMGSFEEFLDAPTFGGFIEQVTKGIGQFTPMAVSSFVSAGTGAIVANIGKGALSYGSKAFIKKEFNRIVKKQNAGQTLTAAEKEVLDNGYDSLLKARALAQGSAMTTTKVGATVGAFGQEYIVGSSQALKEFDEAGLALTEQEVKQALGLGVPQAVLGTLSEVAFYRAIGKLALTKSVDGDMAAGNFFKELAKSAAIKTGQQFVLEGTTEAAQEGLLVAQRFAIDPTYSEREAKLRIGESAFVGAFAGGARAAPTSVIAKAVGLLNTGNQITADSKQADSFDGRPQREPLADIKAQFVDALNPNTGRDAIFIRNVTPEQAAQQLEQAGVTQEEINNFRTLDDPDGNGVLFVRENSKRKDKLVRLATQFGLTESVLQEALQMSQPQLSEQELVVLVRDAEGNHVFTQTTDKAGEKKAKANAQRLYPANTGYTVDIISKDEAAADKQKRVDTAEVRRVDEDAEFVEGQVDEAGVFEAPATLEGEAVDPFDVRTTPVRDTEYVQAPVRKGSEQTKDAFFPVRNLSKKGDSAKVNPSDLENLSLSGNIELNQIPIGAVDRIKELRRKYPSTDFVLEKATEESFVNPGTRVEGFKIRQDGPLEAKIEVVVEDAIKEAREALAQQFGDNVEKVRTFTVTDSFGRGTALTTPAETTTQAADTFSSTPVYIVNLLENKELIPNSDLLDARGNFLTGTARRQRQLTELIAKLALAGKELNYNGVPVLDFTSQNGRAFQEIEIQVLEGGKPKRTDTVGGERQALAPSIAEFLTKGGVTLDQNILPKGQTPKLSDLPYLLNELNKVRENNFEGFRTRNLEATQKRATGLVNRANRLEPALKQENDRIIQRLEQANLTDIPTRSDPESTLQTEGSQQGVLVLNEAQYQEVLSDFAADNQVEIGDITGIDSLDVEVVDDFGVFEPQRYTESDLRRQDLPLTRLNEDLDSPRTTYLSEKKAKPKKKADQFSFSDNVVNAIGSTLLPGFKSVMSKLGMKENVRFMSVNDPLFTPDKAGRVDGKLGAVETDFQKQYYIVEDGVERLIDANDLFNEQKDSLRASKAAARFIRLGNNNIILIDTDKVNLNQVPGARGDVTIGAPVVQFAALARGLIDISHEIGHAFIYSYKDSIIGTPLGDLLVKDFERARKRLESQGSRKYSDEKTGFDEWFADQFAIWVRKSAQNESAKNRVDSYFRTLVNSLKGFYDSFSRLVYNKRFSDENYSQTFDEFINSVTESVKSGEAFNALTTAEKIQAAKDVETVVKQGQKLGLNRKTMTYFKNKAIQMLKSGANAEFTFLPEDKKFWSVSYIFRTADGYLTSKTEEFGRKMYKRSVTKDEPGYINVRIRETNNYINAGLDLKDEQGNFYFQDEKGNLDLQKFNEAHRAQEDESIPIEQIQDPAAKAIRQFKKDFYDNYIKASGIEISERENFSERIWDKALITEFAEKQTELARLLREANPDVDETTDLGGATSWEMFVRNWANRDDSNQTSDLSVGLDSIRARYFANINNTTARDAGLLVDGAAAFRSYISNMVRRVEYHKRITTEITKADVDNQNIQGVTILPDVPIVERVSKNKGDQTKGGWAAYNRELNKIFIDESELKKRFDDKAWSKPKLKGVDPIAEDQFKTLDEWRNFIIRHESAHAKFEQKKGETKAEYENRINQIALNKKTFKVGDTVHADDAAEVMLGRIPKDLDRQGARDTVRNMLGKAGHDMSPFMRKLNSYGLLVNMVTLLPFATIASLPDLAGPMLRSKGMVSFKDYFSQLKYAFANQKEAQQFARDLGLVTHDAIHTMYVNAYELGFMEENAKKIGDGFFKVIQLEWYTKFTRAFAAGMGQRFLIKLAQDNSTKSNESLAELGLTRDQIIAAYDKKSGTLDTSSKAIKDALGTFVDESILRPNAAERPGWASNPYTALIFQLKSFFYAFGKNIMGGLIRQTKNAYNTRGITSASLPLVLAASTLLPLAAIGLEIREFIKYLGRGVTPGFLERPLRGVQVEDTFSYSTAFRTDGMPWGEYFLELLDRAGIFGPAGLIFPMADSSKFGDAWFTPAFGPTAERLEDLLIDGEFRFGDLYPF